MDRIQAAWANSLVANPPGAAVLELHFPASAFRFETPALLAIAGADLDPHVDDVAVPTDAALQVAAGTTLSFRGRRKGMRAYLALHGGIGSEPWLESKSTNLKVHLGGHHGRRLAKGDILESGKGVFAIPAPEGTLRVFPNPDAPMVPQAAGPIRLLPGPEWPWLGAAGQQALFKGVFRISTRSDRMALLLEGNPVVPEFRQEMMSAPVTFGTVQLLPNGNLLVLAADHQTTGGYPRIAQVISADHGRLVQCAPNEVLGFAMTTPDVAEDQAEKQLTTLSRWQPVFSRELREAFG